MPWQELSNPAVEGIFQGLRDYSSKYAAFQGTLQESIRSMSYTYNKLLDQYNKLTEWALRGTDDRGQPVDKREVASALNRITDVLNNIGNPAAQSFFSLPPVIPNTGNTTSNQTGAPPSAAHSPYNIQPSASPTTGVQQSATPATGPPSSYPTGAQSPPTAPPATPPAAPPTAPKTAPPTTQQPAQSPSNQQQSTAPAPSQSTSNMQKARRKHI